jgi:glycosyltransferase involved in cell wall biosynthesis
LKKSMRILHVFGDWKWTGPAEPVLNLCRELESRGHQVLLAYRRPPLEVSDSIEKRVRERGVKATDRFRLNHVLKVHKAFSLRDNLSDFVQLPRFIEKEKFDIINVHQTHGHVIGGLAAKRSSHKAILIRTHHKREPLKPTWGSRLLIRRYTDGLMTFSEASRAAYIEDFSFPPERAAKISPALDLSLIDSGRPYRDMRVLFGIGKGDLVVGTVARFQRYRRTEVLLKAVKLLLKEVPNIKGLLVGRSSQMERSVIRPMNRLGLQEHVVLAGYRTDDYFDTVASMDIFVFLMAGSDGTGRALREAMALGRPVVVAKRGMFAETVEDGVSGIVVEDTPEHLAGALARLIRDRDLRVEIGEAAGEKARRDFRLDRQAEEVEAFYQRMLRLGKWNEGRDR